VCDSSVTVSGAHYTALRLYHDDVY